MKFRWIFLFASNFANSLFMAFVLLSMFFKTPHAVTLIEPNQLIITVEAVFASFIVISTIMIATWHFLERPKS